VASPGGKYLQSLQTMNNIFLHRSPHGNSPHVRLAIDVLYSSVGHSLAPHLELV